MGGESYEHILSELSRTNFVGRLAYHFYNEPLLDPGLDKFVEMTSRKVPEARQVLSTKLP